MAERRMFAKTIIDSDSFLDMPLSSQALYFHLNMRADDDGFINNPKKIARMIGASDDDMRILMGKSFIIPFDSGVVVIKHWRINNYIRNDRYHTTVYQEEKETLSIKENGAYTIDNTEMLPHGIPMVDQMETEVRLGKDSIDKDSIGKSSIDKYIVEIVDYLNLVCGTNYGSKTKNTVKHIKARLDEGFSVDDFKTVIDKKAKNWKGTQMEQYLRPDTLFGTKFESYLNQTIVNDTPKSAYLDAIKNRVSVVDEWV